MNTSNICPDRNHRHPRAWRSLVAGFALACLIPEAHALDPNRAIHQYIHDQWSDEQGFPGGAVNALAQTPDGYLWIGGEKGLVRFDGQSFRVFNHANTSAFPVSPVLGLVSDAEGSLWIRLQSPGLLRYRGGIFESIFRNTPVDGGVTAMALGIQGDILLARPRDPVRYHSGIVSPIARSVEQANRLAIAIAEATDGSVWIGTRDAGVFSLRDGHVSVPKGSVDRKVNCVLPVNGADVWFGTDSGLLRWNGSELTASGVPAPLSHVQVLTLARDRDLNLWVGTGLGISRLTARGITTDHKNSSPAPVTALFEDREGNLWVGGPQGIERYRDSTFLTYSTRAGQRTEGPGPLFVDSAGRTWFGASSGGLFWLKDGEEKQVSVEGLNNDVVYSITGDQGELWIGRQRGGLTLVRENAGSLTATTYTPRSGLAAGSIYAVHRSTDGSVWAGSLSGGVSRLRNGRFTTYTTASGLASNTISAIAEGADGTMWFATPNGLNALAGDRWRLYTSQDGLPPGRVNSLAVDRSGVLWIGTDAGLAVLQNGRVYVPVGLPQSLLEEILGIAVDGARSLWIATSTHVLRVSSDHLLGNSSGPIEVREFGPSDGIPNTEGVRRYGSVVTDSSNRIWFSLRRGISTVDPVRVSGRSAPAIVHVQTVAADGASLNIDGPLRVAAGRQRITFSYIGLTLSVPERVRFRYRLDGFDNAWSEPAPARETVYTNLNPGSYRFRVMATNSEGLWNSSEAAIGLEVIPAVWQTWWFRPSVFISSLVGMFILYRLRLLRLTRQFNVRFEERLAERTRIAQELHDTLLQGLLSASMQLHVVADTLPADFPAQSQLQRVVQLMHRVVDEGRNAVRGLRSSGGGVDDLEAAFSRMRQEELVPESTKFTVIVAGRSSALNPFVRDDVYRIGREALVNAFRHSGASSIEVELDYSPDQLRLVIRDTGSGIDQRVLDSGREGHWGLTGMRERAERIGAKLKVWTRTGGGTEVELTVPGHTAFEAGASQRSWLRTWRWRPRRDIVDVQLPTRERESSE